MKKNVVGEKVNAGDKKVMLLGFGDEEDEEGYTPVLSKKEKRKIRSERRSCQIRGA